MYKSCRWNSWTLKNSGRRVTIFTVNTCIDHETWGKLSIGGNETHGQWIPERQRIRSNYGWLCLEELEYEAILYLAVFSFPHGFFRLSQHVSDTNVLRAKERNLGSPMKKILRAKWNCSNINVVYLLYVTAIIAETIKLTVTIRVI